MRLLMLIVLVLLYFKGASQNFYDRDNGQKPGPPPGTYVPWPYLDAAQVMYAKRVVRMIDVREKKNQAMNYPPNPLSEVLYMAVLEGKLVPYKNDSLSSAMTIEEFVKLGTDTEIFDVPISPDDPSFTRPDTIVSEFIPSLKIKHFRVTEDWIFDKARSTWHVRIVSIAPVFEWRMGGIDLGKKDLCVLKYHDKRGNDIRHLLCKVSLFNRQTDVPYLSYDDFFEKRLFSSYIVKISNPQDIYINQSGEYKDNGKEALILEEELRNILQQYESDLYEN